MISHRMTCLYFVVGGLCLLRVFENEKEAKQLPFTRQQIIEWVYAQQVGGGVHGGEGDTGVTEQVDEQ